MLRFTPSATAAQRDAAVASVGGFIDLELPALGLVRIAIPADGSDSYGEGPAIAKVLAAQPGVALGLVRIAIPADGSDSYGEGPATAKVLAAQPGVASAEFDATLRLAFTPNDQYYASDPFVGLGQWGIRKAQVDKAWDIVRSGALVVAVIDTGVDPGHPDLAGVLLPPRAFLTAPSSTCSVTTSDDNSHGTHVSGIIAANGNNGLGITGVAFGAKILSLKALDCEGQGMMSDVAQAVIFAADQGVRIISISLGSPGDSPTMRSAIQYASSRGALVIVAAGNCGAIPLSAGCSVQNQTSYPAAYPEVLAVGATDTDDTRAPFSTQGSYVDIAAPGRRIVSTTPTYPTKINVLNYAAFSGTSQAAPFVAGLAALVWSREPALTATQVRDRLIATADDLGAPGRDDAFGAGRVNALRAVSVSLAPPPPPPPVTTPAPPPVTPAAPAPAPAVYNVYLPNVTRMLGGRFGWHTPFIVQNVGTMATSLSVKYYNFSDGSLVATRNATVQPGRSFVGSPNDEGDLPANTQFSVVITSTGAPVVAVVNEHQGQGAASEALSYSGFSSGSTKVHLPLVSKMVGGWLTTMIVQNLGANPTIVSAVFTRIGGAAVAPITRTVMPGRSQFIDPRSEASLLDGAEYSVTLTSAEPIGVVANAHNDLPGTLMPMGDSYNGVAAVTGTTTYLPYVAQNTDGLGRTTRVVIQNAGTLAAVPVLSLLGFGGGTPTALTMPSIEPGASYAFTPVAPEGEYSITITGGTFAALATTLSPATAMFNTGTSTTASKLFMPNVTRSLTGGPPDPGWTTPILIQSADATSATLSWYSFSGGSLVATQTVTLVPGATTRVNPMLVAGLSSNGQYAVVLTSPGQVVAIVTEINLSAGDNAMIYKGFLPPVTPAP